MFYGVPVWIIPGLLRAISAEALGTRLDQPGRHPRSQGFSAACVAVGSREALGRETLFNLVPRLFLRGRKDPMLWFMKIKFLDSYGKSVELKI